MASETIMSLREHLSELKRRAKVAFISFGVLLLAMVAVPADPEQAISAITGGGGTYVPLIGFFVNRVKLSLLPVGWTLIGFKVSEALEIYLLAAVLFALIFNMPIFAYELIKFISPGLKETEKKLIYPFVTASSVLFAGGILFGYFFLAKFLLIAMAPFFNAVGANPTIDALDFYSIIFITVALSGVSFTIPVFVYTLIVLGVVKASTFTKNRLIIWPVTYILCAIITPDGGPLLDVLLFVPIITLLELAVFLGGRAAASKAKRAGTRPPEESGGISPPVVPGPPSPPPAPAPSLPSLGSQAPIASAATIPAAVPVSPALRKAAAPQRYCIYCRKPIAQNTVFCPYCGKSNA